MAVMGSVLAATHLRMRSTVGFRLTLLVYDAGIVAAAVLLSRAAQPEGPDRDHPPVVELGVATGSLLGLLAEGLSDDTL